ncbi:MAG TPA: hypothetical protein VGB54_08275 [Allosphingosinicella sp.]|jgi:hypothetical protein
MLFSSALIGTALFALQPDPTRGPRDAYAACLRQFMERSANNRMSESDFTAALPQQCTTQEQAYREAIRRREAGYRTPAGEIDQIITEEVADARTNIREIFAMSTTPRS